MPDKNAFLFWSRLAPEPENEDVAEALRCEVRDPLWLLGRQWQMGEFRAEDAGTAAYSHVIAHTTPLQHFSAPGHPPVQLARETPLDAAIERIVPEFDLSMRVETSREWRKLLFKANKQEAWKAFCRNPLLQFKIPAQAFDPDNAELRAYYHEPYAQTLAALGHGRTLDGAKLYEELTTRKASEFLSVDDPAVNELGKQWLAWVQERLSIAPANGALCWNASRLEYRANAAAILPNETTAFLQAPEHNGQSMNWYTWQEASALDTPDGALNEQAVQTHRSTLMPTPVTFPGMPRARWWEMEDSTIDLSNVRASKTDTGLLLMAEFSLLFSNDWLLTPLSLPAGVLSKIKSIRVTDVFGIQSIISQQYAAAPNPGWRLLQVGASVLDGWLWLPPVNSARLQGEPIEEIRFIRDEMANLCWAIEKTVPDGLGGSIEGAATALGLETWLQNLAISGAEPPPAAIPSEIADFKYRIGNTVPPNWIPFIPFRPDANNAQIVLRRAAMPRLIDGQTPTRIRPRTPLLRHTMASGNARYDIQEEEIPAMGATVRSVWRRTRWLDGRTVTWLAREKSLGKYPESSGLQFDQLEG